MLIQVETCMTMKILIIEDDEDIRELISEGLTDSNCEVIVATSGQNGIDKAQECLPDVIICDIQMPGLNGYQVLEILRKNSITTKIPFIFLTSLKGQFEQTYATDLGADGYLNKPCTIEELKKAIAKVLNSN